MTKTKNNDPIKKDNQDVQGLKSKRAMYKYAYKPDGYFYEEELNIRLSMTDVERMLNAYHEPNNEVNRLREDELFTNWECVKILDGLLDTNRDGWRDIPHLKAWDDLKCALASLQDSESYESKRSRDLQQENAELKSELDKYKRERMAMQESNKYPPPPNNDKGEVG